MHGGGIRRLYKPTAPAALSARAPLAAPPLSPIEAAASNCFPFVLKLVMMILLRNGRFRVHGVGQGLHGLEEDVTLHAELVVKASWDFRTGNW